MRTSTNHLRNPKPNNSPALSKPNLLVPTPQLPVPIHLVLLAQPSKERAKARARQERNQNQPKDKRVIGRLILFLFSSSVRCDQIRDENELGPQPEKRATVLGARIYVVSRRKSSTKRVPETEGDSAVLRAAFHPKAALERLVFPNVFKRTDVLSSSILIELPSTAGPSVGGFLRNLTNTLVGDLGHQGPSMRDPSNYK